MKIMLPSLIKEIVLYGIASPYTYECIEIAERSGIEIIAFIHNSPEPNAHKDISPLFLSNDIKSIDKKTPVTIPLITPGYRKVVVEEVLLSGFTIFADLIDVTSIIAKSCTWQSGFQVNAGVVIGAKCSFGKQVLINRSVSIGHNVITGNYVSFGPACVICGTCEIGDGTFIGASATILPNIKIGKNCIVGAGALVTKNVPDFSMVAGNPAVILKSQIKGYNNSSV